MQDASERLIMPFDGIWRALSAQANAWLKIYKMFGLTIKLPIHLSKISESLRANGAGDYLGELSVLINESQEMGADAFNLHSCKPSYILVLLVHGQLLKQHLMA
ncbi:MAG: hypothetical protein PHQ60_09055 [Sideroxydans sp.]|nr:hypothetical protein [Sideroxydans sp.]